VTRLYLFVVTSAAVLTAVVLLFLRDWVPSVAPSTSECVALWNAPDNAALRSEISDRGYPSAEISGAFSEARYQGCFATFSGEVGEPWALYSATRIPGTDTPLWWRLDVDDPRWGAGFPPPWNQPRPNVLVHSDGNVSLT
jgi:hypothetical protein